jgi:hypothetical protein
MNRKEEPEVPALGSNLLTTNKKISNYICLSVCGKPIDNSKLSPCGSFEGGCHDWPWK